MNDITFVSRHRVSLRRAFFVTCLFVFGACAQHQSEPLSVEARQVMAETAEDLMIVDCLLPGQLRKLGSQATYLSARRPIKTSAVDCEIRGGEYTAFDRANYATALKIWLPMAQQGDPEAQTFVGEIYEKGLGLVPDYQAAATWYQAAVDQGYSRAAINLGHLYEKGLGVIKDSARAFNLYRIASGLKEDKLNYSSAIAAAHESEAEIQRLKDLALQKDEEIRNLKQNLRAAKTALDTLNTEVESSNQALETLEMKLRESKQSRSNDLHELEKKALELEVASLTELLHLEQIRHDQELFSFSRETKALTAQKELLIAALEEQLEISRDRLNAKKTRITELEKEATTYQKVLQQSDAGSSDLVAAPIIEIIDPPMVLTRGRPTVTLRSAADTQEVIGKVVAPAGLLTLKINGEPHDIDEYNLFWKKIPIFKEESPVEIVAIDKRGRRVSVDFSFLNQYLASAETPLAVDHSKEYQERIEFGQYHALLIGNNDYQNFPKLRTAVNDVKAVEAVLRERYGFKTKLLIDADRYTILSALDQYRRELTASDNLLVYYAGHGELDRLNERGYWLPVDAAQNDTAQWISNGVISDVLSTVSAKHVMVVADSCYAGTLSTSSVARTAVEMEPDDHIEWVKIMVEVKARTVLTSGGIAPVMDGGGGRHSVFANAFLRALNSNQGILEGYGLYRDVLTQVRDRSSALKLEQIPDYAPIKHAGHEAGEFFFQLESTSI